MHITHIVTSLHPGGAQVMLYRLLSQMDRERFEPSVIALSESGLIGDQIEELAIPVHALGMKPEIPNPVAFARLVKLLRQERPQVVQTWLYHPDLLGGLAAKLVGRVPVAWGIHSSNLEPGVIRRRTIWIARMCAQLSKVVPARIICCSEASMKLHVELGYAESKMRVIPNGFDLSEFAVDPLARTEIRQELGVGDGTMLIGLVARFHPQKDHRTFIEAARLLHREAPDVHFLMCGQDINWQNRVLASWIADSGLRDRCHLLDQRSDVPRIQASLDIASTSASSVEAFPLVVGEAMACGVPCVVTDVGDSAFLVGETGRVVPPRDPVALMRAWHDLTELGAEGRARLGGSARERIEEHFNLPDIARRYETLYEEIGASKCAA